MRGEERVQQKIEVEGGQGLFQLQQTIEVEGVQGPGEDRVRVQRTTEVEGVQGLVFPPTILVDGTGVSV